jgi:hypothetical protein
MKKIIYTLSFVALFAVAANAQDSKSKGTKQEEKNRKVNDDGTVTQTGTLGEKKEEPKKSGTRMAINEKGTSGGIKPKTTAKTEEKKSENPATQPGPGKKD